MYRLNPALLAKLQHPDIHSYVLDSCMISDNSLCLWSYSTAPLRGHVTITKRKDGDGFGSETSAVCFIHTHKWCREEMNNEKDV